MYSCCCFIFRGFVSPLQVNAYVRKVFNDKEGNLWLGTYNQFVCRYDGKSQKYFTKDAAFTGDIVRDIHEDKSGNLWFATNDGVFRYDGNSVKKYSVKEINLYFYSLCTAL